MSSSSADPRAAPPSTFFTRSSSRFTHRHLQLLRNFSTRTPLRVVAHIDLDAFYAQCEMVRLNTPREQPLAVQQWDSLIAVNYAARPFKVSRLINAKEAKKLCPQLVLQHVATFREGEGGKWVYRDEGDHNVQTDKVSLDPYRAESKKILEVIKAALLAWAEKIDQRGCGEGKGQVQDLVHMVRVEKAGIDEVFVDLSALVYGTLVERYPTLQDVDGEMDVNESVPPPPTAALDWRGEDELVDLDVGETEEDDPDWDDVAMLVGAEIVRAVRRAIWERLKYTCSGGIARNKMMAKLGSACNKPNKQTIVRNRATQQFLSGFKFTKIRMLGGKLGQQIASLFGTEEVKELLEIPLSQLKAKLDDDTGTWLYELIRGNEHSEINTRTQIKSMLSTKSFRPHVNSSELAEKWLRIFVADIYGRLTEENILENKRRPKVIAIHYRQSGQSRSRQIPIPSGKTIDEDLLFGLAKTLLSLVIAEGNIWPCANLSLTVSGFEEGVTGTQSLDHFFSRQGNTQNPTQEGKASKSTNDLPSAAKKRKIDEGRASEDRRIEASPCEDTRDLPGKDHTIGQDEIMDSILMTREGTPPNRDMELEKEDWGSPTQSGLTYMCPRCSKPVHVVERDEHEDWHFAMDLDIRERGSARVTARGTSEKRQTRLAFG